MNSQNLACRLCNSKDTKLYSLAKYNIKEEYRDFVGKKNLNNDYLSSEYVCFLCMHHLRKAIRFRRMCILIEQYLQESAVQMILSLELPHVFTGQNLTVVTISNDANVFVKNIKFEQVEGNDEKPLEGLSNEVNIKSENEDVELDAEPLYEKEALKKKKTKVKNGVISNKKKKRKNEAILETPEPDIKPETSDSEDEMKLASYKEKVESAGFCASGNIKKEGKMTKDNVNLRDVSLFAEEIILSVEEQKAELNKKRQSEKYESFLFKCDLCFSGYNHKETYDRHMKKHDPSVGEVICPICAVRKADKYQMAKHRLAAHDKKFKCKMCGHISNTSSQARAHYRWHNGFTYQCQFCGKTYKMPTSFLSHLRIAHPSQFVCDVCGERFLNLKGVHMHKIKQHNINIEQSKAIVEDESSGPFCAECDMHFTNEEAYSRHMITSSNHAQSINTCRFCDERFASVNDMASHLCTSTRKTRKLNTECSGVECKQCGVKLRDGIAYRNHVLRNHTVAHASKNMPATPLVNRKIHPCDLCPKMFSCRAKMKYHRRTHTGEKAFYCPTCKKGFSALHSVRDHIRTHTGDRPFVCDKCNKAFASNSGLWRHQMIHAGLRRYNCDQCGKKFSQSNSLKVHVHTVHNKMPPPYISRKRQKTLEEPSMQLTQLH